jgi:hypothetical protein
MIRQYNIANEEWEKMPELRSEPIPRWNDPVALPGGGILGRMGDGEGGSLTIDMEAAIAGRAGNEEPPIPEDEDFHHWLLPEGWREMIAGIPEPTKLPIVHTHAYTLEDAQVSPMPTVPDAERQDREYLQELLSRITVYAMELEDEVTRLQDLEKRAFGMCNRPPIEEIRAANGLRTTTRTFYEIPEDE